MTWVVVAHAFIPALLIILPDKITNLHTPTIVVTFSFAMEKKPDKISLAKQGFLWFTLRLQSRTMNQREGSQLKVILIKFQTNQSMLVSWLCF